MSCLNCSNISVSFEKLNISVRLISFFHMHSTFAKCQLCVRNSAKTGDFFCNPCSRQDIREIMGYLYRFYGKAIYTQVWCRSGLPWWLSGKEPACQWSRCRFDPWVAKIPWRRKWLPTPIFLPGELHGQRSLAGYSSCSCKRVRHTLVTTTTITTMRLPLSTFPFQIVLLRFLQTRNKVL